MSTSADVAASPSNRIFYFSGEESETPLQATHIYELLTFQNLQELQDLIDDDNLDETVDGVFFSYGGGDELDKLEKKYKSSWLFTTQHEPRKTGNFFVYPVSGNAIDDWLTTFFDIQVEKFSKAGLKVQQKTSSDYSDITKIKTGNLCRATMGHLQLFLYFGALMKVTPALKEKVLQNSTDGDKMLAYWEMLLRARSVDDIEPPRSSTAEQSQSEGGHDLTASPTTNVYAPYVEKATANGTLEQWNTILKDAVRQMYVTTCDSEGRLMASFRIASETYKIGRETLMMLINSDEMIPLVEEMHDILGLTLGEDQLARPFEKEGDDVENSQSTVFPKEVVVKAFRVKRYLNSRFQPQNPEGQQGSNKRGRNNKGALDNLPLFASLLSRYAGFFALTSCYTDAFRIPEAKLDDETLAKIEKFITEHEVEEFIIRRTDEDGENGEEKTEQDGKDEKDDQVENHENDDLRTRLVVQKTESLLRVLLRHEYKAINLRNILKAEEEDDEYNGW